MSCLMCCIQAFSKVIQKLIPQLPTLENLLDMFISNSRIEKAFLFDVLSKIYIATGSSRVPVLLRMVMMGHSPVGLRKERLSMCLCTC